jgi:hypothetical protein
MQKYRYLYFVVFLYLLAGCVNTPASSSPQPALTTTPSLASPAATSSPIRLIPTATATVVATNTLPPLTLTATSNLITPGANTLEIVKVCPDQPEVPLAELGLADKVLVVELYDQMLGQPLSPSETGAVIVPLDNPVPQQVPNTVSKGDWKLVAYGPSSDRTGLNLTYEDPTGQFRQVWYSSWDGQQQRQLDEYELEVLPESQYRVGLGDGKSLVIESDPESLGEHPVSIYDSATEIEREIPPFPENTHIEWWGIIDGVPYMAYFVEEDRINGFALYNLDTFTSIPAFQWLNGKEWVYSGDLSIWGTRDFFVVEVAQSYGLDLGWGLNLQTIMSADEYNNVMQTFYLPGGDIPGGMVNLQTAYLVSWPGIMILRPPATDVPMPVYFLDLQNMILRDYCHSFENSGFDLIFTSFEVAPDERFVAFVALKWMAPDAGGNTIDMVEIFDLETGRFVRLLDANFDVIGWGMK